MKKILSLCIFTILGLFSVSELCAMEYNTIFIHGAGKNHCPGGTSNGSVACPTSCGSTFPDAGDHSAFYHVCYDPFVPYNHESNQTGGVYQLVRALNARCRAINPLTGAKMTCQIICHSMGCAITEYVMDRYNDLNTYHFFAVGSLASAAGGSPLATAINALDLIYGFGRAFYSLILNSPESPLTGTDVNTILSLPIGSVVNPIIDPLTARNTAVVNHNDMNGVGIYLTAGYGIWELRNILSPTTGILTDPIIALVDLYLGIGHSDGFVPISSGFMRKSYGDYANAGTQAERYDSHFIRPGFSDNWTGFNKHHMQIGGQYGHKYMYQNATPYAIHY